MIMGTCYIFCAAEMTAESYAVRPPAGPDDLIIAADGGLRHTQALGLKPDLIIGDFDSLGSIPAGSELYPVEKDDTDSMLAVRRGLELGYRSFMIYGAMDGIRVDHTVANLQTLQFLADRGADGCLIGTHYIAAAVKNGFVRFAPKAEGILSVFCMGPDARGVTLRGLHYPMEDGCLTAGFPLGVSNHFTGKEVYIGVRDGSLLLLWERSIGLPADRGKLHADL